jgi:urea transport system substrate-binding protein
MACPSTETIDDLMANRLPADRADEVRRHIADCPFCQEHLGQPPGPAAATHDFLSPPREPGELGWLGPYRIRGVLGEGGMAIVFDAEEPHLARQVALKVLRPNIADASTRERFLREARALAALPPSHVVHLYAVGEANGLPYFAMERLRGESLESRLQRDRSLSVVEALRIAREAAEGLAVVHEHGLVHRDVKPANIWLESGPTGAFRQVKLLDFGIVRDLSGEGNLTQSFQVVGTPVYMASEQASGEPVDGRTDLYSLGCVLYRMVTGRLPFDNAGPDTMAVLRAAIRGDTPKVREQAPQLSPAVAELIEQLLSRQPADRPASAEVLVERLRRLEQQEQQTLVDTRVLTRPGGPGRRRPRSLDLLGIGLGALAVVAALVVGVVMAYQKLAPARLVVENGKQPGPAVVDEKPPIKVGALFSMSGTVAFHELPVMDAVHLAIEEINAEGGVLGRRLEAVDADGASEATVFAEQAEKLIEGGVEVIFGCWTSASRKLVADVCGRHDRLLFYPPSYEGLEDKPNVVYLGGTPNQNVIPMVRWLYAHEGKRRFFLVGSEGVASYALNEILEHELKRLGAAVAGKRYLPLGDTAVAAIVAEVGRSKADFIINSMDGQGNVALFEALRKAGITPRTVPTAWLSISEPEMVHFKSLNLVGDYSAGCYFSTVPGKANEDFLARFRKRFGAHKRVNDPMESAYTGVFLWKQAVEKAGTTDTNAVRDALRGLSVDAPEGPFRLDAKILNAWRTARVGRVELDGSRSFFKVVDQSPAPLPPEPFPKWRSRQEWEDFLQQLYKGWGDAWEKQP